MKQICVNFIREIVEKYDFNGCVIGISGGLDSAVVGALCCEAVGSDHVMGLLLPERDSAKNTLRDSKLVCNHLGIRYKVQNIKGILKRMGAYSLKPPATLVPRKFQESYVRKKWEELSQTDTFIEDLEGKGSREFLEGLAFYRVKHRTRMCLLYLKAEQQNYAVMGTSNKTELMTGFYVKWGDDSTDIEPVKHLYKTQIFELAKTLELPPSIIAKAPSPDLIPGITDEFALKIKYQDLDRILMKIENDGKGLENEYKKDVDRVKLILAAAKKRKIKNLGLKGGD